MQITGLFARLNTFLKLFLLALLYPQGTSQEGEGILSYQSFCKSICYCPTFKPCGINCPFYIAWQEAAITWEQYLQTPEYWHHNNKKKKKKDFLQTALSCSKVRYLQSHEAMLELTFLLLSTLAEGNRLLNNLWFSFVVFCSVFLAQDSWSFNNNAHLTNLILALHNLGVWLVRLELLTWQRFKML